MQFPTSKPGTYGEQLRVVGEMNTLLWELGQAPDGTPQLKTLQPVRAEQLIRELNALVMRDGGSPVITRYDKSAVGLPTLTIPGEVNLSELVARQLRFTGDDAFRHRRPRPRPGQVSGAGAAR